MKTRRFCTLIICFLAIISSCNGLNKKIYPEDWKANKHRDKQINSLIKSNVLIGKSYNEVIQLLGKEDLNSKRFDSLSTTVKFTIQYLTGGGKMIDLERLLIIFDSSKVVSVEKYYD